MRVPLVCLLWLAVSPASGQEPAILKGHTAPVSVLAFSPDGKFLVSAGSHLKFNQQTGKLDEARYEGKAWDLESQKEKFTFKGFVGLILRLAVAPDGKTFASAGGDPSAFKVDGGTYTPPPGDLRVWNAATGAQQSAVASLRGVIQALAYSPDGKTLAFGTEGIVRLLDHTTAKDRSQLKADESQVGTVATLAYSADGTTLASLGSDGVRLWSSDGQLRRHILNQDKSNPTTLALTADGKTIAVSSFDLLAKDKNSRYVITLLDADTGKPRAQLRGHEGIIHSLAFSSDAKVLASAGEDGYLKLWDVFTAKCRVDLLQGECGALYCVAFSKDGLLLAAGGYDRTISLWRTDKLLGKATTSR